MIDANSSLPPKKEIIGLDIIRFVCALSVVLCHLLPELSGGYTWASYGGSGVDIFFVISGFIIPQSSEGRSPFLFVESRIVRLVPGVWICATLSLVSFTLLHGLGFEPGSLGKYVRSLLFVPVVPWKVDNLGDIWIEGVYWTLFVEICFYSVILGMLLFNKFKYISILATVLGSVSLAYWGVFFISHNFFPDSHFAQAVFDTGFKRYLDLALVHQGAWFGLGINFWLLTKTKFTSRVLSILICFSGGLLQEIHHGIYSIKMPATPGVIYCIIGCAFILFSVTAAPRTTTADKIQYSDRTRKACRWIGLTTYPLYLIHSRLGHSLIDRLSENDLLTRKVATFLTIPTVIVLAFLIAYFLEPILQKRFRTVINKIGELLQGIGYSSNPANIVR